MITQEQIDELKEAGVDVSNVKPGTEQYFYIEESDVSKPTRNRNYNPSGKLTEKQQDKVDFAEDVANNPEKFKVMRTIPGSGGRKIKLNDDGTYKIYDKESSPVPGRTSVTKEELMKIYPIKKK